MQHKVGSRSQEESMKDENKTKEQLINELVALRQEMVKLEKLDTERKQADEALRESEENFRNIFQSVPESLLVVSSQMEVLNSNEAFSGLIRKYAPPLNMSEDELRKRILSELRQHFGRTKQGIIEIGKSPVRKDS